VIFDTHRTGLLGRRQGILRGFYLFGNDLFGGNLKEFLPITGICWGFLVKNLEFLGEFL
jgi:hypothetical protein